MPPYTFPASQTSLLSLSELCVDPTGTHTVALSDATEARTRFRNLLKDVSSSNDWLSVIDAAQSYLPQLYGMIASIEADEVLLKGEPNFPWRSSVNSSSPTYDLPTFGSELIFVLTTLASSYNNLASSLVPFSSSSKAPPTLTSEQEKRQIENLSAAADNICRAAGVFEYVAEKLIPMWQGEIKALGTVVEKGVKIKLPIKTLGKGKGKMPAECSSEVVRGLAMMTLADANALAVTKLLSPFHSSVTYQQTSLPLPRGHPSPSLLAKLYINIATLYTGARGLLKTGIIKTKSQDTLADSITIDDDIDSSLLSYLRKESILAEIRSRKWLGVEAGESGAGEKIGIAIAWLDDAKKRIKDLQDTGGTTSAAKGLKEKMSRLKLDGREERKERKGRLEVEGTDIEGFLKLYTHMNKTVHFQPVAPASSLQSLLPLGRPVLQAKPFQPPRPAFGPGSIGYVSNKLPGYEETEREVRVRDVVEPEESVGKYFGAGSYY